MSAAVALADAAPALAPDAETLGEADIAAAMAEACGRIAPLWPLRSFVAVNPFLGFTDRSFADACATLRRVAGADVLMPRGFYREAVASGAITEADLATALAAHKDGPADLAALHAALAQDSAARRPGAVVATVADLLDAAAKQGRQVSRTRFMVDEIGKWCAAYFDEGQSAWRLPVRGLPPYPAWRATMRHDRNPEVMGIRGFRAAVAALPEEPVAAVADVVRALGIPRRALADYLFRALFDIGGWAAYARHLGWTAALHGRRDDTLAHLLAIRVVWGYALFQERQDPEFRQAWHDAMAAAAALPADADDAAADPDLALDLILHDAYEAAYRRRLLATLARPTPTTAPARPAVQAAFCIDVRSEVIRRALEAACPGAQTLGFAGFFGFPIEYVPIGREHGSAQCPVLLKPAVVVCEAVAGAPPAEEARVLGLRLLRRRAAKAWKAFKLSAVSSFAYVETAGLLFAAKLVGDSLGLTRPVADPRTDGLDASAIARLGPRLEVREVAGRATGFAPGPRLDMAEAVLRGMSLTSGFAPLVLLTGHGSSAVNNPHAAGLDCGACGGHTGEANARVAASVLNDAAVREGLRARGIDIPQDTWFLGCLHDTTTDEIRGFDTEAMPPAHRAQWDSLRPRLAEAAARARTERATLLGLAGAKDIGREVVARSRDWSQVRPEWGLVGNAAFIAAPRARTLGMDLHGRAFLHDYDWRTDRNFAVLELILTAPMVVASWINLQYFAATTNNRVFGSGNKTLHNVTGQLGVLEGNAGDLRAGLPLQSVHDGSRFVHEPLRLHVFVAAPEDEIARVIERHEGVRRLVDNNWVYLFALGEPGAAIRGYAGGLRWESVAA